MIEKIVLEGENLTLDELEELCQHARDVGARDEAKVLPYSREISIIYTDEDDE